MITISYVQQIEENVKRTDFIKELEQLGATFKEGGKHTKVYLNGQQSTIPRHRELNDMLVKGIRKQLGVGG